MMTIGSESSSAAAASHYSANARLIATYAGVTMVAPPGRAARERGRPHRPLTRVSFPLSPSTHKQFAVQKVISETPNRLRVEVGR